MKTAEGPGNLRFIGGLYGLAWGWIATLASGMQHDEAGRWYTIALTLSGIPIGMAVTRLISKSMLKRPAINLVAFGALSLFAGTLLFGVATAAITAAFELARGFSPDGDIWKLPLMFTVGGFLAIWPLILATLNCWDLRRRLNKTQATA